MFNIHHNQPQLVSTLVSFFNIILQHLTLSLFHLCLLISHETADFVIGLCSGHTSSNSNQFQLTGRVLQVKGQDRLMMVRRRVVAELRDHNPHYRDTLVLKSTWQPSSDVQLVSHTPVFVIRTEPFPDILSFIVACLSVLYSRCPQC